MLHILPLNEMHDCYRNTNGYIPPTYSEFYTVLRQHAELLDSTKRQTRSQSIWGSRRANLAYSDFDKNFGSTTENDFNNDFEFDFDHDDDNDENEDIQAYIANQNYNQDTIQHMKAFAAFKQQQRRRMPKEGGIVIPRDLYNQLPRDFKIAWEQLTADQQQQISKLGKDPSNNTKPRKSEQM